MCTCHTGFRLDASGSHARCVDIDECDENPRACGGGGGTCVNVDGGYECICPRGFMLSGDGQDCIDMRKGVCYLEGGAGNCSEPMSRPQTRVVCCCSMGKAWGVGCSDACPAEGSADFRALCGTGTPPGMIIDPMTGITQEVRTYAKSHIVHSSLPLPSR